MIRSQIVNFICICFCIIGISVNLFVFDNIKCAIIFFVPIILGCTGIILSEINDTSKKKK